MKKRATLFVLLAAAGAAHPAPKAVDPKKCNEICYFIRLEAQSAGRYRDAADSFWLTMEAGTMNNRETRWALNQLGQWPEPSG